MDSFDKTQLTLNKMAFANKLFAICTAVWVAAAILVILCP